MIALDPDSVEAQQARRVLFHERRMQVGKAMPPVMGHDVDGAELRLADYSGRIVVVDFFGFWCAPCREGLPVLKGLLAKHPPDELAVLGVNAYDDEETFRRERERSGVTWPCLFDGKAGSLSKSFGITSFPAVFVLDRQGIIRARNPSLEALESVVDELIQGQ